MIVKLKKPVDAYPDLTFGQHYVLIGIDADDLRLLNDHGRPYVYPHHLFDIVDPRKPSQWVMETGEDGEVYAYPPEFNEAGFFEDFFDGKRKALAVFWGFVNRLLLTAKALESDVNLPAGASV